MDRQPQHWGGILVQGLTGRPKHYDSPSKAASALGLKIVGARDMVQVFARAGYTVVDEDLANKGKGFRVLPDKSFTGYLGYRTRRERGLK